MMAAKITFLCCGACAVIVSLSLVSVAWAAPVQGTLASGGDAHWTWLIGETCDYSNWHITSAPEYSNPIYPNATDGTLGPFASEFDFSRFQTNISGPAMCTDPQPSNNTSIADSYMIEYTIPEPATVGLLLVGTIGLLLYRRR